MAGRCHGPTCCPCNDEGRFSGGGPVDESSREGLCIYGTLFHAFSCGAYGMSHSACQTILVNYVRPTSRPDERAHSHSDSRVRLSLHYVRFPTNDIVFCFFGSPSRHRARAKTTKPRKANRKWEGGGKMGKEYIALEGERGRGRAGQDNISPPMY